MGTEGREKEGNAARARRRRQRRGEEREEKRRDGGEFQTKSSRASRRASHLETTARAFRESRTPIQHSPHRDDESSSARVIANQRQNHQSSHVVRAFSDTTLTNHHQKPAEYDDR